MDVVKEHMEPSEEAPMPPLSKDSEDGSTPMDVVKEHIEPSEEAAIPHLSKDNEDGSTPMDVAKENIEQSEEAAIPPLGKDNEDGSTPMDVVEQHIDRDDERGEGPQAQCRAYPFGPFAGVQAFPPPNLRSIFTKAANLLTTAGLTDENVSELRARLLEHDPIGHAF
eukprot:3702589-Amphidinium_carterae.1